MDCAMVADIRHLLAPHERPILSLGRGCPHCRHTGYRGRRGIFEVLVADQHIRTLVEQQAPDSAITDAARAARMTTLEEAGKLAAVRGLTTAEELVQNVAEIWGH
jgi:type II secretory ATPase GspE/PulE/Tfp pilus assembly ATPase PilB-like protein